MLMIPTAGDGSLPSSPQALASERALQMRCSLSPALSQAMSASRFGLGAGVTLEQPGGGPLGKGDRFRIVSYVPGDDMTTTRRQALAKERSTLEEETPRGPMIDFNPALVQDYIASPVCGNDGSELEPAAFWIGGAPKTGAGPVREPRKVEPQVRVSDGARDSDMSLRRRPTSAGPRSSLRQVRIADEAAAPARPRQVGAPVAAAPQPAGGALPSRPSCTIVGGDGGTAATAPGSLPPGGRVVAAPPPSPRPAAGDGCPTPSSRAGGRPASASRVCFARPTSPGPAPPAWRDGGSPHLAQVSCHRWALSSPAGKRKLLKAAKLSPGQVSSYINEVQRRGGAPHCVRPSCS